MLEYKDGEVKLNEIYRFIEEGNTTAVAGNLKLVGRLQQLEKLQRAGLLEKKRWITENTI